jgi:hypothetical protein
MSSTESRYKYTLSNLNPERPFPDELLVSIFELCLPTVHDYADDQYFPLTEYAPIRVMHVCRHWRDVTISNSKLWTVLYLGVRLASQPNQRRLKDILAVWEERSRYRTVIISLSLLPPFHNPADGTRLSDDARLQLHRQAWASLLPQLSQLLAHCKRLEIRHVTEDVLRVIEDSDGIQELVCLRNIDELMYSLPHPALSIKMLRLCSFECRLNNGQCLSISLEELLIHAGLSSTKLRRVVLVDRFSTQTFIMLATAVPTLEELDIRVLSLEVSQVMRPSQPTLSSPNVPPLHSSLIRLSIVVWCRSPITSDLQLALKELSFPHLRHLRLNFPKIRSTIEAVVRSLAAVLHRSQSPVESLHLSLPNLQNEDTIEALLRAVPQLVCLRLHSINYQDVEAVISAFMTPKTELICPHLKCISFESIRWLDPKESARSLLEFISARFADPENKLSRLGFVYPDASGGNVDGMGEVCAIMTGSAQFEMCRERGLELQTIYA